MNKIFKNQIKPALDLDPNFVTGLTESEGSFSITKHKNNKPRYKINFGLRFKISMLSNETELLNMIKNFFNCGFIENKNGVIHFIVRNIDSIKKIIIPHFLKYPLRGTKYLDFLSFKKVLDIFESKEHLTEKGINELIKISENMNTFRKFPVSFSYSPIHAVENNVEYIPLSGHFVNDFIAGDGCLTLNLKGKNFGRMSLQISQHINNKLLLVSIANYFKSLSRVYYHGSQSLQVTLSGTKL